MDITVELHCDLCGSANLSFPPVEDTMSEIACNDCGERHGSVADLKEELVACAVRHSAEAMRSEIDRRD
jgi:hypothetical protein